MGCVWVQENADGSAGQQPGSRQLFLPQVDQTKQQICASMVNLKGPML
jgi:hypothetical protein